MIELIGKLINWQTSLLHVGLSLDDPTYAEGYDDWAALSGQRVRVTVEVIEAEPTDRLAGCKCKECGGPLCVHNHTEHHTYVEYPYAVWCNHCGKPVGPHDTTAAAAIDAYDAYLARLAQPEPSPRCPHCGGKVRVNGPFLELWVKYEAFCTNWAECAAHGAGPTREAALDALAEWLKPAAAQWWNKRSKA